MTQPPEHLIMGMRQMTERAEAQACKLLLIHLLTELAGISPAIRASLEGLLATTKVSGATMPQTTNDDDLLTAMTYAALAGILGSVSEGLPTPLTPRPDLRSV